MTKKIVVAITGASGTIYGLRLLEALVADPTVETHLVMSTWAKENLAVEATGYTEQAVRALADNLIARAADVTLKERRPLLVVPRESPFNQIHLENMLKLARMGVEIIPPIPAFYNQPKTIDDLIDHNTMKLLDHLHLSNDYSQRWQGLAAAKQAARQEAPHA